MRFNKLCLDFFFYSSVLFSLNTNAWSGNYIVQLQNCTSTTMAVIKENSLTTLLCSRVLSYLKTQKENAKTFIIWIVVEVAQIWQTLLFQTCRRWVSNTAIWRAHQLSKGSKNSIHTLKNGGIATCCCSKLSKWQRLIFPGTFKKTNLSIMVWPQYDHKC